MDRVTNIAWKTASGATLGGFAYEYDAVGRIVSRDHVLGTNAFCRSYSYDSLDRLASDDGVTYTYDAAGNRMTKTANGATVAYTLGVGDRLASWTGGAYTHDIAGNVAHIERTGSPALDLTWNSRYQLVSVSTNGVFAESYAYDALGRRVSTTTLEGTTRHVYDDNWQVVADLDEQDNVVASYTWGDGIDHLLAVKVGGSTYYPLTDIQGTVWGYVDSQNNVVARWQYDAWGNVVDESVSVPALASLRYRFQCREWSAATGLVNFRMRWYDPETGRWLSKDPIGLGGGMNLYAFCGDTFNGIDPSGCNVYVSSVGGYHAKMWVDDPDHPGSVCAFEFGPLEGSWDDFRLGLIYGPGHVVFLRGVLKQYYKEWDACIETSAEIDRRVIAAAEKFNEEDQYYGVFLHNCVHAISLVLQIGGIDNLPPCITPNGLIDSIQNRGKFYNPFVYNPYFCPLR